jgi:hypothetical protein
MCVSSELITELIQQPAGMKQAATSFRFRVLYFATFTVGAHRRIFRCALCVCVANQEKWGGRGGLGCGERMKIDGEWHFSYLMWLS